jgi:hypothetical protein
MSVNTNAPIAIEDEILKCRVMMAWFFIINIVAQYNLQRVLQNQMNLLRCVQCGLPDPRDADLLHRQ